MTRAICGRQLVHVNITVSFGSSHVTSAGAVIARAGHMNAWEASQELCVKDKKPQKRYTASSKPKALHLLLQSLINHRSAFTVELRPVGHNGRCLC